MILAEKRTNEHEKSEKYLGRKVFGRTVMFLVEGSLVDSWESLALDDSPMPLAAAADAAPGPAAAAAGYYDVPPGVRESTPRSIYHVSSGSQPLYGSSSAAAPASWRPRAQTDANGLRN